MELEELSPANLAGPQQDVEPIAAWADRNGVTCDTARAWVYRGIIPSVKLGKLRMINCALPRRWLPELERSA
ncbi:DNA-binding protein [Pseudomonas sp. Q1-7]|uniref:DNA-binding protein n=1 Tax=Pseudomonas sp. Q1-7 TaxID=3020843 RepID=UPI0023007ED3|nr:DNA-binding protein [Pseudomonas sp. Q1-7]